MIGIAPDVLELDDETPLLRTTSETRPCRHASKASGLRVHQLPFPLALEGRGTLINRLLFIESVDLIRFFTRAYQSLPDAHSRASGNLRQMPSKSSWMTRRPDGLSAMV